MSNSEFNAKLSAVARLTKSAIGPRTIHSFSEQSGLSRGWISRLINERLAQIPTAKTLWKIAQASESRVTYDDLAIAAGYSEGSVTQESYRSTLYSNVTTIISDDVVEICSKIEQLTTESHQDFVTCVILAKQLKTLITLQNLSIEIPNNIKIHYALVLE